MNKEVSKDMDSEIRKVVDALNIGGRNKEVLDILQDHLIEMLSDMRMGFYNKSKEESAENTANDSVSAKTNPQLEAINKAFEKADNKHIETLASKAGGAFILKENNERSNALTREELLKGGWFMRSATVEDRDAFLSIDINVLCDGWGVSGGRFCDCSSGKVYPCCISELEKDSTREIIRIGSNFFYK